VSFRIGDTIIVRVPQLIGHGLVPDAEVFITITPELIAWHREQCKARSAPQGKPGKHWAIRETKQ
jgi:hypothetical protein